MSRKFIALSPNKISRYVSEATRFMAYAAPGISKEIAEALSKAREKLADEHLADRMEVILDTNAEVCRLGYGDIEGINHLEEKGFIIRSAPGLRIGVLVCDDKAWIFSPTPLLIEEGSDDDNAPNALEISHAEALRILNALKIVQSDSIDSPINSSINGAEIGEDLASRQKIDTIKQELEKNPPQKFNLARKVHVFNSYLEYVDFKLVNCQIQRHTFEIPKKLLAIVKDKDLENRIRTTVSLIGKKGDVSGKKLQDKANDIRQSHIKSLGEKYGNVILRAQKEKFLDEIEKLKKDIETFQDTIKDKLKKELDDTLKRLIEMLRLPVKNNPPKDLLSGLSKKPTNETVENYLNDELRKVIPTPDELVKEMKLDCKFKGITYETLTDNEFTNAVKKAFPYEEWEIPFDEYTATPALRDSKN